MFALQLQRENTMVFVKRGKKYNDAYKKKRDSFGSNTFYEQCYRHNDVITK